ncbi:hypothetical protein GOODEAATRI_025338 [Goodea atripinnis]|uniref:TSG101 and ALIX binding domain-containing protein n=1 Tax=Goodea atripinnis TaxID=208336 RepID=A0ABV0NDI8_9TELE
MPGYKCNRSLKKKLSCELVKTISSLRKENVLLKKTLAEVSHHCGEHNKLMERLLALETLRLESCQQLPTKDGKPSSSSEDLCTKERNSLDGDSPSEKQALEKNKQWLEYDQQREAYVRAILDKMLWLEKQLNEANQAHSKQHNKEHSDEEAQIQIKGRFESLLKEVHIWLDMLRKQVEVAHGELTFAEKRFKERENELEALTHQLKSETISKGGPEEECHNSDEEEQHLREETKELQAKLKEEKRRSTNFELQASLYQRYMLNHHHADQEKIADLERQRNQQDLSLCGEVMPPTSSPRDSLASSSHSSMLNESLLECPTCQAEYPASQYRELLKHLEICLE